MMKSRKLILSILALYFVCGGYLNAQEINDTLDVLNIKKLDLKIDLRTISFTRNFFVADGDIILSHNNSLYVFDTSGCTKNIYVLPETINSNKLKYSFNEPLLLYNDKAYFFSYNLFSLNLKKQGIQPLSIEIITANINDKQAKNDYYFQCYSVDYTNNTILLCYRRKLDSLNKTWSKFYVYNVEKDLLSFEAILDEPVYEFYFSNNCIYYFKDLTRNLESLCLKMDDSQHYALKNNNSYQIIGLKNNTIILKEDVISQSNIDREIFHPILVFYNLSTQTIEKKIVNTNKIDINENFLNSYEYGEISLTGFYFFYSHNLNKIYILFYKKDGAYVGEIQL